MSKSHYFSCFGVWSFAIDPIIANARNISDEKTDRHGPWPSENALVSLGAIGEGWHNWHHKYPFDYAASEYGVSSQFNPSKLFIDMCACVGLVWGRKRGTAAWQMGRARRDRDAANGVPLKVQGPRPWEIKKTD